MSDTAERVSALSDRIEEEEKELGAAVRDLKEAARRMVGPTEWIRERPLPFLAGAMGLGLLLGIRARRAGKARR
jgi:ElaB/YqjD/DUF883 family membrane-anchored ribosome-binding protein